MLFFNLRQFVLNHNDVFVYVLLPKRWRLSFRKAHGGVARFAIFLFLLAERQSLPSTDYWFVVGGVSPERNWIYGTENGDSYGMCTIWKRMTSKLLRFVRRKKAVLCAIDVFICFLIGFFYFTCVCTMTRAACKQWSREKYDVYMFSWHSLGKRDNYVGVLLLLLRWKKKNSKKKNPEWTVIQAPIRRRRLCRTHRDNERTWNVVNTRTYVLIWFSAG